MQSAGRPQSFRVGESSLMPQSDPWWSTKLDFGGGEPFNEIDWSSTLGTAIKIGNVFGGGSRFFDKRDSHLGETSRVSWKPGLTEHRRGL
jgi:hypothetical protein